MLKALLRIQFLSLAGYMFKGRHRTKKRSPLVTALIALLAVYIVAVICLYFGMLFISICEPFYSMGLGWLYFSFAGLTAFAVCFITGIFIAQSQLFDAKDNELLLSLPIPPKYILASRILTLLLLNYALTFAAAVPCAVVSFMTVKVTFTGALNFIFAFLLLPLPAAALTCLAGWLIAEISSRMKHKNLVSVVISVALLLAYMAVMMRMQGLLAGLAANGAVIGETVKSTFPPLYRFGAAIANRDTASLLIFALWALVPFAAVCFVLSKNFVRIAVSGRGVRKTEYREKSLKVSSARLALTKKELLHLASSYTWILNGSLGSVFLLILAALAAVKSRDVLALAAVIPNFDSMKGAVFAAAAASVSSMNILSAPSVSLEGKHLWISKSLPVPASDILMAKANMHIAVTVPPCVIAAAVLTAAYRLSPADALTVFLTPTVFSVFMAYFGVAINLHFPRFDWTSEVMPIKQGLSTTVTMFSGMAIVIAPCLIYAFLLSGVISASSMCLIFTALAAAAAASLRLWLKRRGSKIFDTL